MKDRKYYHKVGNDYMELDWSEYYFFTGGTLWGLLKDSAICILFLVIVGAIGLFLLWLLDVLVFVPYLNSH